MYQTPKGIQTRTTMEKEIQDIYNQLEKQQILLDQLNKQAKETLRHVNKEIDRTNHDIAKHICSHIAHFPRQNNAQEVFDT